MKIYTFAEKHKSETAKSMILKKKFSSSPSPVISPHTPSASKTDYSTSSDLTKAFCNPKHAIIFFF